VEDAIQGKQNTITDGDLTMAKRNGLQAALDNKYDDTGCSISRNVTITGDLVVGTTNVVVEIGTKQDSIQVGDLTITQTAGLQDALNSKFDDTGGSITGNVTITGGLSVDTITTTGNVDVGGLFLAPNQVSFKAGPATSNGSINTSIVLPFDRVIYNIGNAYDNLTYKFIAPVSGVYFFYSHFFSSGNNKYTADFLLDDGTGDTLLYRIERSTTRIGGTTNIPASFTTQLNSGDQVYIKRTDGVINMPQYPFSQFGGHLLA